MCSLWTDELCVLTSSLLAAEDAHSRVSMTITSDPEVLRSSAPLGQCLSVIRQYNRG